MPIPAGNPSPPMSRHRRTKRVFYLKLPNPEEVSPLQLCLRCIVPDDGTKAVGGLPAGDHVSIQPGVSPFTWASMNQRPRQLVHQLPHWPGKCAPLVIHWFKGWKAMQQ